MKTTADHHILVVIYNITVEQSKTIDSLTRNSSLINNSTVHIWDNSPLPNRFDVKKIQGSTSLRIKYIHTPENTSLSVIYNKIAKETPEKSYLTILDQDTDLPSEYFSELAALQEKKHPLILPIVLCRNTIVSPGRRIYSHGMLFHEIASGAHSSKNLLAINSGMSISHEVFSKFNYDSRLRFYGTDTYFMRMYEKFFSHAYVMSTRIDHSLAEMEDRSSDWRRSHLQEKIRTFGIIFNNSPLESMLSRLHCLILRIKYSLDKK
jgi:GT2 family glycosyltransferase